MGIETKQMKKRKGNREKNENSQQFGNDDISIVCYNENERDVSE